MTCGCQGTDDFLRLISVPDGAAGTREVLKHMRELVKLGKRDPRIRNLALQLVRAVQPKHWLGEIAAIFHFVRSSIKYQLDINAIELVQEARVSFNVGAGDCDDLCIAAATLCEVLGHPAAFCAMGFDDIEVYSHVVVLVSGAGDTELISLDASEPQPMGWFPPGATHLMVAPIEAGLLELEDGQ